MPTVNRYGGLKVATAPLPGVRKSQAETALSEGAGVAEADAQKDETAGQAIGRPLQALGLTMLQDEREKADQTALLKAQNQLAAWKTQALYDPANGAFTKKGEAALPLPEDVQAGFTKASSDIAAGLSTPKQRLAWDRISSQEWQGIDLQVRRHVFSEMQDYQAGQFKSFVGNKEDEAIRSAHDPSLVGVALGQALEAIDKAGPKLGLSPDAIAEQKRAVTSNVHSNVIAQLLASDEDQKAKIYFDAVKGDIKADRLDEIGKAIEEGTLRGTSQKKADEISAAGGSLTEQLAKAKAIDDPKLRDHVEQRLERLDAMQERAQREANESSMRTGYDIIDRTGDPTKIPPAQWATYSGPTRAAMWSYATAMTKGVKPDTDWPTYYTRMQEAGTDPNAFATRNLIADRAKLGDAEFKQLTDLQLAIRKSDRNKSDQELAGFRTKDQIVTDTLTQYGIDAKAKPDTAQGKANAELRRMLDLRVEAAQQPGPDGKRKKVTDVEIQGALDDILGQQKTTPGSWWGLVPGNGVPLFSTTKRLIDTTVGDIPASERPLIEAALRAKGRPVTDATVLDLYIENSIRRGGRK